MLNLNIYPFMDAEGVGTGVATGYTETVGAEATQNTDEREAVEMGADERKTGMDVKSEAQRIADAMVAKKLKNMPSKEELAAFRKWQDEQKTEAQGIADVQKQAADALLAAERREARANAVIAAAGAGFRPEHIDDAVILAMARANDNTTIEDAMQMIAQANPSWKSGAELPRTGSNPATGEDQKKFEIKRHF